MKNIIRSDCNKHIVKREHYVRKDNNWKPKKLFNNESEAIKLIKKYKYYNYIPYLCSICGKWHIGLKAG